MKKKLIMLAIALVLFVGCPLIIRMVMPDKIGMMATIFLLLVIYPVFFIANGIISIADIKKNWYTTLVFTGIFAVSYAVIINMKEPYYYFIYLILGYITTLGGLAVKKMPQKKNKPKE